MSPDAWMFLGGTVATVGTVVVEGIRNRRQSADAKDAASSAAVAATTAAERAKPVSNGFTGSVLDLLGELRAQGLANAASVDQIRQSTDDTHQRLLTVETLARQTAEGLAAHLRSLPSQRTGNDDKED